MISEKYDKTEPIQIGDLISYFPETDKVVRAKLKSWRLADINKVIGVCTNIQENQIFFDNSGIVDVNVKGIICIGDKLTVSEEYGKAEAIKYGQDETIFRYRSLGKVIGLYNDYNKAKVLLDIE